MKLLLFSDLHGDVAAAESLAERSRNFDVVVGAGDFGNMRRGVEKCIHVLKNMTTPTVLVPGNNESAEELRRACDSWPQVHVLHGSGVTLFDVPFWGIGGGIPPTPFGDWSFDFSEEQAAPLLQDCPLGAVLVSHSPPQGAVDRSSSGQNLGSVAVRKTVLQKQPRLVVCGHVHACAGQSATIGRTPVVNAGPKGIRWNL
ncbi:MAG TPA: metallophosphoesterase family protein [Abditibacteriaceae bacterium]|nr:metallophosphoesterase family protein [Abditibacteriaceae bacterium]